MSLQQQTAIAVIGIALAVIGFSLAIWLYWRGGGRRTHVKILVEQASKNEHDQAIALVPSVSDCKLYKVSILNIGPRDAQVLYEVNLELKDMQPHIDVPPGYAFHEVSLLKAMAVNSDADADVRFALRPHRMTHRSQGTQQVFIHVHRLRAGRKYVVYLACRALVRQSGAATPLNDSLQFKLFTGWIENVNVTGGDALLAQCDGKH